jgi:hypothetical protein
VSGVGDEVALRGKREFQALQQAIEFAYQRLDFLR